jgi:RNA polymerase sigma-70 factor, ECF subfamily
LRPLNESGDDQGLLGTFLHPETSNPVMTGCHDDLMLVEACRAGQTEAFGILVQRYQDRLYSTIVRLVGAPEDAQDVLQDAFVRAFEKLDQFHGESSFYTWIYRIAVNLALSSHRKRKQRRKSRSTEIGRAACGEELADDSAEIEPSSALERVEREAIIEAAIAALGPEQRAVVVLKDFDGRRYEEISALLGIPIGTVRSRLHRARCELRERLRSLVDGDENSSARRVLHDVEKALDT